MVLFVLCLCVVLHSCAATGPRVESLGCWSDSITEPAIESLEGRSNILAGDYSHRQHPIKKCKDAARSFGFTIFAIQAGGFCTSSATALGTYDKYGASTNCDPNGRGGPGASEVYTIMTDCLPGWVILPGTRTCYLFNLELLVWSDAQEYCKENDAHLVIIRNEEKQAVINSMLAVHWFWYIGLVRNEPDGWKWLENGGSNGPLESTPSSENPEFFNWDFNQPNNEHTPIEEECVAISRWSFRWHDISCGAPLSSVCEKEIEGELTTSTAMSPPVTSVGLYNTLATTNKSTDMAFPAQTGGTKCVLYGAHSYSALRNVKHQRAPIVIEIFDGGEVAVDCHTGFTSLTNEYSRCLGGRWFPPLPTCLDIDECDDGTEQCGRLQTCINTVGSYQCVCQEGYSSDQGICIPLQMAGQQIIDGQSSPDVVCDEQFDTTFNVLWPETMSNGFTKWMPCPSKFEGLMVRFCDKFGKWDIPDTADCKSTHLANISKAATTVNNITDGAMLLQLLKHKMAGGDKLLGGDMLVTRGVLSTLATTEISNSTNEDEVLAIIKPFLEVSGMLLSNKFEKQWRALYKTYGPGKSAATVIKPIESFSETLYQYMIRTERNVYLKSNKIDVQGYFIDDHADAQRKNNRKPRSVEILQGNNIDITADYLTLPESFLQSVNSTAPENSLAVVIFIIRELEDVLPPHFKQKTSTKRTWVDSTTAIKKVYSLNTVLFSATLHSQRDNYTSHIFEEPVIVRLYEKKEGHSPQCSLLDSSAKNGIWDASECRFLLRSVDDSGRYVECGCDRLGPVGVIMTMGEEPVPFLHSARKILLGITSGLSAILIGYSFIMLCIARMTSDRYVVLSQSILSLAMFSTCTCISTYFDKDDGQTSEKEKCWNVAIFMDYLLLCNSVWMLNMCIQQVLRLMYVDRRMVARTVYFVVGWLLPAVVVAFSYLDGLPSKEDMASCRLITSTKTSAIPAYATVLVITGSAVIMCYARQIISTYLNKCEMEEGRRLWENIVSTRLLLSVFVVTRLVGYCAARTDNLLLGYLFAFLIFFEGSTVFMRCFAINIEVLTAIQIRLFGDADYKDALNEYQETENVRLTAQRQALIRANDIAKRRKQDLHHEIMMKRNRSKAIIRLFEISRTGNRVCPMTESEI
ncbi:adhesion G protein-coupled receptor E1-like [Ptychodera flava]|uniref:adhesion G protein-coupled receptor E1-like n=1 Tax=Ptychodera flava TaxID=63121 RepID=UPI00396A800D